MKKMKLEIYRKRTVPGGYVVDDVPETVFNNISWFNVENGCVYGNTNGEELHIEMDKQNYQYFINMEED